MRHTVTAPGSLGACLAHLFPGSSGRTRKQMLGDGRVRVNGTVVRVAATAVVPGDVLQVGAKGPRPAPLSPGLTILYEDDDVIVVDKPAGLLTIATASER